MASNVKLTKAQVRMLSSVPDDWQELPLFGDKRPLEPLVRLGMCETRHDDVTPPDFQGVMRWVKAYWRRTPAGLEALREVEGR